MIMVPEMQENTHGVKYFVNCDICGVIDNDLTLAEANAKAHQHNVQNDEHYAEAVIEHG